MLDTTILIDSLRGVEDALHVISGELESSHTLFYSVISRVEIYAGIRSNEVSATEDLLASLWEVGINRDIAQAAGDYMRAFQRSHGLEIGDALIALFLNCQDKSAYRWKQFLTTLHRIQV